MSYCRFGPDSDVYVYATRGYTDGRRYLVCSGCGLAPPVTYWQTAGELLAHLEAHRAAGHQVPERAFERLRREAAVEWATERSTTRCPP